MKKKLFFLNKKHANEWRNPLNTISFLPSTKQFNWSLAESNVFGDFWGLLQELQISLIISREYENFVLFLKSCSGQKPRISVQPLPHPSGITYDKKNQRIFIASTRNPNQIIAFEPTSSYLRRNDTLTGIRKWPNYLIPTWARFLPGSYYIHDIAMIHNELHANAVGHNSISLIPFSPFQPSKMVWMPKHLSQKKYRYLNYIQLNSIAPAKTLHESFFTASCHIPQKNRPGHLDFKVDKQGVVYSGATREVYCTGLTRPHSLRFDDKKKLYVANSGYGELRQVEKGLSEVISKLESWTRGIYIHRNYAFVGCSKVIHKFRKYAPGIKWQKAICGIKVYNLKSGTIVAGIEWPLGNQIFSIEGVPNSLTEGFVFEKDQDERKTRDVFYTFNSEE